MFQYKIEQRMLDSDEPTSPAVDQTSERFTRV